MSWFKDKIISRVKEPSSLAGVALIATGVDKIFDINELQVVSDAATAAASSTDWLTALVTLVLGLAAIFVKESGSKK